MVSPSRRPTREPSLVGALTWFCIAFGCSPEPREEPPAPAKAEPTSTPTTAPEAPTATELTRIEKELQAIAEETAEQNIYLGDKAARRFRSMREGMQGRATPMDETKVLYQLGTSELVIGNEDTALEHLERARELADGLGEGIPPDALTDLYFVQGVAWLRKGESQNCCARHNEDSCLLPIRGDGVHVEQEGSRRAMAAFVDVLERSEAGSPVALRAQWLLNVAAMTVGDHPDGVPEEWRIPAEAFESSVDFPRFRNRAGEAGLATESLAGGAIGDDFDGDGDIDVVVSSWDAAAPMHLYRNEGSGRFTEASKAAGLERTLGGLNMIQADYDDDGDLDILVLRGAWLQKHGRQPNSLLRNDGAGHFEDVTYASGLGAAHYPTQTAAWADIDLDGDLDLYVGNESTPKLRASSQLFRNEGDGTFTDIAAEAGVENRRFAKGVTFGDVDGDRHPDLFVSNLGEPNRLYRNLGDGTFEDIAESAGVVDPSASFPAWFWDANQDGKLDLFVAGYEARIEHVAADFLGQAWNADHGQLYLGDGKGGFRNVTDAWGLKVPAGTMGSNHGDLDGDGWLDFYLGTGYPDLWEVMPNRMLRNVEGRRFEDVTLAGGFGHLQKGHAVVFADFDGDGDIDVFEQMGGAFPVDRYVDALYENPGFGHAFVRLELRGTRSNHFGVGARVEVVVVDAGGAKRTIYRHVGSGGSFGANPLTRSTIGLGDASAIESVQVYWPVSDTTSRLLAPELGSTLRVEEPNEG